MDDPFRSTYRELTPAERSLIGDIKDQASRLLLDLEAVPDGRYKALAKTALEEAVMWATKGVTG